MAALKVFTVNYGGIRIKVRLLPTVRDVHREHQLGHKREMNGIVQAFFAQTNSPSAKHFGTMVLPMDVKLLKELVPHEVTHAVISAQGGVLPKDDEDCALAVGRLSARIFRRIEQIGAAYG